VAHSGSPRLSLVKESLATDRRVRLCAALGALAIAFSSILVRLSHASPSTAAVFRCAYALPVLGFLALREDRRLGRRGWQERRIAIASGIFFAADLILWHRSIADTGAGLATVLVNVQVVLVPLVAWAVLSERPGRWIFAAIPIALCGLVLISGVLGHPADGWHPERGTLYGLGAGFAYAAFLLLLRHGGSDLRRPAGPLFDATATATIACIAAGLLIGDLDLVPRWPGAGWLITLALSSQVLGWLLITASLPRLAAALASVLLTINPLAAMALAAVILSESPTALQLAGVAAVLTALIVATGRTSTTDRGLDGASRGNSRTRASTVSLPSADGSNREPHCAPDPVPMADFEHWDDSEHVLESERGARIAQPSRPQGDL
jgi:drug/metabolite transporter (DMT)-like permease